jgi:hypothetical protein
MKLKLPAFPQICSALVAMSMPWCMISAQVQMPDHFDFWSGGKWISSLTIYAGDTVDQHDVFLIQMDEDGIFRETWTIDIGEGETIQAKVFMAFDQETKRWKLFYLDGSFAQFWDSEMKDEVVYFTKRFTFNEVSFYSRQSWRPGEDGKIIRILERSENGQQWTTRYYQVLEKKG